LVVILSEGFSPSRRIATSIFAVGGYVRLRVDSLREPKPRIS